MLVSLRAVSCKPGLPTYTIRIAAGKPLPHFLLLATDYSAITLCDYQIAAACPLMPRSGRRACEAGGEAAPTVSGSRY